MMAGAFTGRMPFADVYIHGLVRDEQNKKMSKSAGNGIDPLLLIDRYGTDALRFALVREVAGAGQDIRLDYDRKTDRSATVEASRNFANKLWNATRFALLNLDNQKFQRLREIDCSALQLTDRWILSRLARVKRDTANRYENYGLGEAAKGLYEFAWNDCCDWYLELLKPRLNPGDNPTKEALLDQSIARKVLVHVLSEFFVLLHPLMPHLTEELWHALTGASEDTLLALQPWPDFDPCDLDDQLEESFCEFFASIRLVRNLRAVAGLKPSQEVPVRFITSKKNLADILQKAKSDIQFLTRANHLEVLDPAEAHSQPSVKALAGISGELEVLLPIEGLIDLEDLRSRLAKDLLKAEKEIQGLSSRLANSNFVDKAPKDVVAESRAKLAEAEAQASLSRRRLSDLN